MLWGSLYFSDSSLCCYLTGRVFERKMFSWWTFWISLQERRILLVLPCHRSVVWPWSSCSVLLPLIWLFSHLAALVLSLINFSRNKLCIFFFCQALRCVPPHLSILPNKQCLSFQQGQSSWSCKLPGKKRQHVLRFASSEVRDRETKQMPSFQVLGKKLSQREIQPTKKKPISDTDESDDSLLTCPWENTWDAGLPGFISLRLKKMLSLYWGLMYWQLYSVWSKMSSSDSQVSPTKQLSCQGLWLKPYLFNICFYNEFSRY